MAISTFTAAGAKATTPAKLDKDIFAVEITNHELLKVAYIAYLSNSRQNLAVTKTRGLVRGGGKKPWKQKGTGRARFGSSRNPIWRSGGIVFGPTGNENYVKTLNTKAKRTAIRQALTLASNAGKISVIDDVVSKEGKTADLVKLLTKINANRNVLIIVEQKSPELLRAARNLQGVEIVSAKYLNVFSILNADCMVFTKSALAVSTDWLSKETK